MNNAQRSTALPRVAVRVSASATNHIQVWLAPNLAFLPPPHVTSLNRTVDSMEVSVISLTSLRFISHSCSVKANHARQWPASSNRISDGCGAISVSAWSAPLYPAKSSQGALAAWQQVISAACFCCPLSPYCLFQIFLWYTTYLPRIPILPSRREGLNLRDL